MRSSAASPATQAPATADETGLDGAASPGLIQASIGSSQLLAWPNDRRLHVLDPLGAALLNWHHQGCGADELAALLTAAFDLQPGPARAQVQAHQQLWLEAGLLHAATGAAPTWPADCAQWRLQQPGDPVLPASRPHPLPPDAQRVVTADRHIALRCANALLHQRLNHALGPAHAARMQPWAQSAVDHALTLHGADHAWRLDLDDATVAEGATADAALAATLRTLTELGCRPADRLLVAHGAGLVGADGRGTLLVAPGGSGKTTLAAALDAEGFGLLSDDVVPVSMAGELLGLGLPLCLKPGSWPVLGSHRPTLASHLPVQRFGQLVRFAPALNPAPGAAVPVACLLLSRYAPGQAAGHESISPEQALQGLLQAEAVMRDLTQAKLQALARWLDRVPAYRLQYPDLASGVRLVRALAQTAKDRPKRAQQDGPAGGPERSPAGSP